MRKTLIILLVSAGLLSGGVLLAQGVTDDAETDNAASEADTAEPGEAAAEADTDEEPGEATAEADTDEDAAVEGDDDEPEIDLDDPAFADLDEQTYEEDDDDFVPTEEIPADQAIPFPTDI